MVDAYRAQSAKKERKRELGNSGVDFGAHSPAPDLLLTSPGLMNITVCCVVQVSKEREM